MSDNEQKRLRSPSSMLGSIAGKIASTSHLVRDKTEQINTRVHDHWAKTSFVPTKTVDEEFEDLVEELEAIIDACHEIIKLHQKYISVSLEIVQSSQRIASSIQVLSSPNAINRITDLPRGGRINLCERTKSYSATMVEIGLSLNEALRSIPKILDERVHKIISYLEKINEHIEARDKSLLTYDKVYDKFDGMTIVSTTSDLNSKQKQEYNALEKKLAELKGLYDVHNAQLKSELPCFFKFVRAFMEPLMQFLFYVHLTAAYQVQSNLESIALELDTEDAFPEPVLPTFISKLPSHSHEGKQENPGDFIANLLQMTSEANNKRRKGPEEEEEQETKRPTSSRSSEGDGVIGYCRAVFDHPAHANFDLEFRKGDMIGFITCQGERWTGIFGGKYGSFPGLYVEKL